MNRIDDRIGEAVARHLHRDDAADEVIAGRVLKSLRAPLPRQRHSLFDHWPSLFLTRDYAPAWPRLAALACVALFGCMVGLVTPSLQRSAVAQVRVADLDAASLAFDSEPITGARP